MAKATQTTKATKATQTAQAAKPAQPTQPTQPTQAPPATPVVAVTQTVLPTAKAQATVAAQAAKNGGVWLPKGNSLATLQALLQLGATGPQTAVLHGAPGKAGTLAGVTGRAKGNNCRGLAAAGLVVQLSTAGSAGHLFYLTPQAVAAMQPAANPATPAS